eukprot:gnl/Spiro4/16431_TR8830_c0_g1_i1.p1 gnl/Spiro4/16431_TR8830_c0_g1~~gnl/Spiro4/16431_TR8830_c0_g1_i1.p1  ORF type:complete len:343 (-),score=36.15 gnl/Spiro4/16431_TR8830_c0_g1_i1:62-1024(-)
MASPSLPPDSVADAPFFITPRNIRLVYQVFGSETGEPLLLVMGMGGQMLHWRMEFIDLLVAAGFRVIRFDNRDSGMSTKFTEWGTPSLVYRTIQRWFCIRPRPGPYTLDDMAIDAFDLLDHLRIDSCHVAGASMGGMIAQCMALLHPHRVRSLVSIMSTPGNQSLPGPSFSIMRQLIKTPPKDYEGRVRFSLQTYAAVGSPKYHNEARALPLIREAVARAERGDCYQGAMARQAAAIMSAPDRTKSLARLTMPSAVIHGQVDYLVPVAHGHATHKALNANGTCDLIIIPDMAHDLPPELFPEIAAAVTRTAQRASATRTS